MTAEEGKRSQMMVEESQLIQMTVAEGTWSKRMFNINLCKSLVYSINVHFVSQCTFVFATTLSVLTGDIITRQRS